VSEVLLTGLQCDVPIAAMAAFGLLRLCSQQGELGTVRLHWAREGGVTHAVLTVTEPLANDDLVRLLVDSMAGASQRAEFAWSDSINEETYRPSAKAAILRASAKDHREAEWFAAFRSDLVKGRLPFDTTSGQQGLLSIALRVAESLDPGATKKARSSPEDAFREALFGPWKYDDDQHSLGWDPTTVRLGAYTAEAPTKMEKNGVRAVVWLAMESLPLFSAFCVQKRLRSCGFTERNRAFCWPIWNSPATLATVKSLLSLAGLYDADPNIPKFRARGIQAVYRSRIARPTKYGSLQPAVLWG
jgi:hypothetical protein